MKTKGDLDLETTRVKPLLCGHWPIYWDMGVGGGEEEWDNLDLLVWFREHYKWK